MPRLTLNTSPSGQYTSSQTDKQSVLMPGREMMMVLLCAGVFVIWLLAP